MDSIRQFDSKGFSEYMYDNFPSVFEQPFAREWLENTLQWVTETFENDPEKVIINLNSMLPYEVEIEEIENFMFPEEAVLNSELSDFKSR